MRIARILIPAALAAAGLIVPALAAAAAPTPSPSPPVYVPPPPHLTLTPGTIVAGSIATLVGTGFVPGDTVTIDVTLVIALGQHATRIAPVAYTVPMLAPVKTVTADVAGSFTTTLRFDTAGTFTITATDSGTRAIGTAVEVVTPVVGATQPVGGGGGGSMPVTGPGTNYPFVALVGSAIAATGVVLVVLARSRRRRPTVES